MREQAFYLIFSNLFSDCLDSEDQGINLLEEEVSEILGKKLSDYAKEIFSGVLAHKAEIDVLISSNTRYWKADRLSKISLAILYVAVYEILYVDTVPSAAAINEAVELAKTFGDDSASSFVNGILGTIVRNLQKQEKTK